MIQEASLTWDDCLPLALWAYRTTRSTTTKQTPFSLVYGAEVVLPTEIKVPSQDENSRTFDLEALEGKREEAQKSIQVYQRKVSQAYNKPRIFQEGDLVLKAVDHAMKGLHASGKDPMRL